MKSTSPKDKDSQQNDELRNAGIAGLSAETVNRYGSAIKEHFVAYSGKDNEIGQTLKRSLQDIADSKINPQYQKQNLRQQAGFSAEIKETARYNAKKIVEGSGERKIRTDDLGQVNDPLYDHLTLDQNGNIVAGSGAQMKFVGSNPKEAFEKLISKKYAKYRQANAKLEVPADYYDGIQKEATAEIEKLQSQLARAKTPEQAAKLQMRLDDCRTVQKNLQKSEVSNQDALFARLHPKLSTAQDVVRLSAKAGAQTAAFSAAFAGSISIIGNLVAVAKGDKSPEQAVGDVAQDTGSAAVVGGVTGFTGSALKGIMQNATSQTARSLSKTALPAAAVTVAMESSKTLARYAQGEIDGVQCFEQLGEQGYSMVASAMFATIGQIAIPVPIVGALIGSMLGYALASASYETLLQSQKEAQWSHEERLQIEAQCAEQIDMIRAYRADLEQLISQYLCKNLQTFQTSFDEIKTSLAIGDVDGFVAGANSITEALGKKPSFHTLKEFDTLMSSDMTFQL